MKKFKLITISLFLSFLSAQSVFSQETQNISSYYASPTGAYERLRLVKLSPPVSPIACNSRTEGTMYYDPYDNDFKICNGASLISLDSAWTLTYGSVVSLADVWAPTLNQDLFVGIGTTSPEFRLHIENGGLLSEATFGDASLRLINVSEDTSAFLFYPVKGALRIGFQSPLSDTEHNNIGSRSIGLGNDLYLRDESIFIGTSGFVSRSSIGIGAKARITGENSIVLFTREPEAFPGASISSSSQHDNSVNIGGLSSMDGSVTIGIDSGAPDDSEIIIGKNARAVGSVNSKVFIGDSTGGTLATAVIGKDAGSIAGINIVGSSGTIVSHSQNNSLSVGISTAMACYNTAIGQVAYSDITGPGPYPEEAHRAEGNYATIIGGGNKSYSWGSVAIGSRNEAGTSGFTGHGVGRIAFVGCEYLFPLEEQDYRGSVAIGVENTATETGSIALGVGNTADGQHTYAIGHNSSATTADFSYAFGENATVTGNNAILFNLDDTDRTLATDYTTAIMGGRLGIGTTAPVTTLDVTGSIIVGTEGGACNASNEGELRYTVGEMQYCDGGAWVNIRSTPPLLVPTVAPQLTTATTDGTPPGGNGYGQLKNMCTAEFPGTYVCSTAEVVNYYGMGNALAGTGWVVRGGITTSSEINDCQGWTSVSDKGIIWDGTELLPDDCGLSFSVYCCQ